LETHRLLPSPQTSPPRYIIINNFANAYYYYYILLYYGDGFRQLAYPIDIS
jgi:hypothetical protein